jgi:hypothetical protein
MFEKPQQEIGALLDDAADSTKRAAKSVSQKLSSFKTYFINLCSYAFLETYDFDGFDIRRKQIATSTGYKEFWRAKPDSVVYPYTLSFRLVVAIFLGLPSRLEKVPKIGSSLEPTYILHIDWLQFFRGLIRGWDPITVNGKREWTPKKVLQVIAAILQIKTLIFIVKFVTFPLKFLINILKLATEFLPSLVSHLFASPLSSCWSNVTSTWKDKTLGGWRFLHAFGYLLLTLFPLIPFLIGRGLKFFGMNLTSPDKSARVSYTYTKKSVKEGLKYIRVDKRSTLGKGLCITFGLLSGLLSVLTTAGMWAVALPLVLGAVFAYFPALVNVFSGFLQIPAISAWIASLESTLAVIGIGTSAAYGTLIATLAGVLSVKVTAVMLLVGTALGAVAAPVCSLISRLSCALADWWHTWRNQPFLSHFQTLFVDKSSKHGPIRKKLTASSPSINADANGDPSKPIVELGGKLQSGLDEATGLSKKLNRTVERLGETIKESLESTAKDVESAVEEIADKTLDL